MKGAQITLTTEFVQAAIEAKLRNLFKDTVSIKISSIECDRHGQALVVLK